MLAHHHDTRWLAQFYSARLISKILPYFSIPYDDGCGFLATTRYLIMRTSGQLSEFYRSPVTEETSELFYSPSLASRAAVLAAGGILNQAVWALGWGVVFLLL